MFNCASYRFHLSHVSHRYSVQYLLYLCRLLLLLLALLVVCLSDSRWRDDEEEADMMVGEASRRVEERTGVGDGELTKMYKQ